MIRGRAAGVGSLLAAIVALGCSGPHGSGAAADARGPGGDAGDGLSTDGGTTTHSDGAQRDGLVDSTGDAGGGTALPVGGAVGCALGGSIWTGSETLLNAFPTDDGIIVVTPSRIALLARDGQEQKAVLTPRPLTTAAFDGETLTAADAAIATAYDRALTPVGTVKLTEPCSSSVMVGGRRFVCSPGNDWDHIFYTYDMVQQARIGTSAKFTYHGVPIRRVPKSDHFVSVPTDSFPADYRVYRVDPLGAVMFLGETPYHGDFLVNLAYGFVGHPISTHLVTPQGLLLKIFNPDCLPDSTAVGGAGCLVKDGAIGTLASTETFLGLASDRDRDLLYAVVGQSSVNPATVGCGTGCKVQQIDPVTRLIVGQRTYPLPLKKMISTEYDQSCQMLLLGYLASDGTFKVDLLEHGGVSQSGEGTGE